MKKYQNLISKVVSKLVNSTHNQTEISSEISSNKKISPDSTEIDPVEEIKNWISSNVKGKTFADVGGIGVNSINERITLASKYGATSVTMIDIRPSDYYEWDIFHKRCKETGVHDYQCIDCADINNPKLLEKVGFYDFVHCTGIVYHLPNPVWGIENLSKIVKEYLIINTVIIPSRIKTECGSLEFYGSTVLFMPGLNSNERKILNSYYMKKFNININHMAPMLEAEKPDCPWFEDGKTTCWPYWWLFTEKSFIALVKMMGFEILDTALWENHALTLLAKKKSNKNGGKLHLDE